MEYLFLHAEDEFTEPKLVSQTRPLVTKVHFSDERHQKAFASLTPTQQRYIEAYVRTGSPTAVLEELKLTGRVKQVSKRLSEIAKRMGCSDVRELRGACEECEDRANATALKEIVESQEYACALTGRPLTPKNAELDHKVPISKGGDNSKANLQWLHKQVNRAKGTMSQSEFIAMCQEVADWTRSRQKSGSLPGLGN